jgi:hypothetical protein
MRHPSPAARAIMNNPTPTTTTPLARAKRSPAGAKRSTMMTAATTAIARRFMTPITRNIAIRLAQQLRWRLRCSPCRRPPASYGRAPVLPDVGKVMCLPRSELVNWSAPAIKTTTPTVIGCGAAQSWLLHLDRGERDVQRTRPFRTRSTRRSTRRPQARDHRRVHWIPMG